MKMVGWLYERSLPRYFGAETQKSAFSDYPYKYCKVYASAYMYALRNFRLIIILSMPIQVLQTEASVTALLQGSKDITADCSLVSVETCCLVFNSKEFHSIEAISLKTLYSKHVSSTRCLS